MPELHRLIDILSELETVVLRLGLLIILIIGIGQQIRHHLRSSS